MLICYEEISVVLESIVKKVRDAGIYEHNGSESLASLEPESGRRQIFWCVASCGGGGITPCETTAPLLRT